jgi:hypothetical protein
MLALIGPACRPDVLARALRVLRSSAPDPTAAIGSLARTLLAGIERRDPSEWWALVDCAETLGVVGAGHDEAARVLDEALAATLAQRARCGGAAEELAAAIVRALPTVGAPGRVAVPTLSALLGDPALADSAQAALGALDATAEIELPEECVIEQEVETIEEPTRRVRPLSREDLASLGTARRLARGRARSRSGALPGAIVRAIAAALPGSAASVSEDERADLELELGVLWGDQVVRAVGWEWMELCWETWSAPAIVAPERSHACFPMRLIADAIETGRAALVEQVFRRIRQDDLPGAEPGELAVIG